MGLGSILMPLGYGNEGGLGETLNPRVLTTYEVKMMIGGCGGTWRSWSLVAH